MEKIETIEDLYKNKMIEVPKNLKKELGHINIFKLEQEKPENQKPHAYIQRDFFKISFVIGESTIVYADKEVKVEKQSLVFSNPYIPYQWLHIEKLTYGIFCIFNQAFFQNFGNLSQYNIFQPKGTHVFNLDDNQVSYINDVFQKMNAELNSDYIYKNDVLRNHIFEIIHFALKMQPNTKFENQPFNANKRISLLFAELLERQFPIDENHTKVRLRTASEFAEQLNIHVNHLNRAIKETTQKTTSQLIAERILQESKILIKQSQWSISDIAFSLGFSEVTHFNNFFKKLVLMSPTKFRIV